ncbi:MAG: L-threonylcarbamoyladenylate synthase [Candidatus Micrarchaeia archaeon]
MPKMKTTILKREGKTAKILAAALRRGQIAVFPTETVYGLGCDATNAAAVKKIFAAKRRPSEKALPVVVSSLSQIAKYAQITPLARSLAKKFMPGPLTLVVPMKKGVKFPAASREKTIAFRITSDALLRRACRLLGQPVVATSANISGKPPAGIFSEAQRDFSGKVPLMVDGGTLAASMPSTVLCIAFETPVILREGQIPAARVLNALKFFAKVKEKKENDGF